MWRMFEKPAQPDYKGTLQGGRAVVFEAKHTSTGQMEQSRVTEAQAKRMEHHQELGALCFVVAGFGSEEVYGSLEGLAGHESRFRPEICDPQGSGGVPGARAGPGALLLEPGCGDKNRYRGGLQLDRKARIDNNIPNRQLRKAGENRVRG